MSAVTAATALLAALQGGDAAAAAEPVPNESVKIALNDGTLIGVGETITFTFTEDAPNGKGPDRLAFACPEVNDSPVYTITGTPYFLEDIDNPKSTWLLPRQSVAWAVTGSHTFTWDIGAGTEAEAGIILTKAKVKFDTKISNSWVWSGTQTVTDTNTTTKGYRAVLGQVGWKLSTVKSWFVAPCTEKKKNIVVKTPRKGDMSIGRQNS